jgi:hypothetical protein
VIVSEQSPTGYPLWYQTSFLTLNVFDSSLANSVNTSCMWLSLKNWLPEPVTNTSDVCVVHGVPVGHGLPVPVGQAAALEGAADDVGDGLAFGEHFDPLGLDDVFADEVGHEGAEGDCGEKDDDDVGDEQAAEDRADHFAFTSNL